MKLTANERKTVLLALLIAWDTEEAFIDAHSKNRLRKGNIVRYTRREDRPTIRKAQSRVARFAKLYEKMRVCHNTATKPK